VRIVPFLSALERILVLLMELVTPPLIHLFVLVLRDGAETIVLSQFVLEHLLVPPVVLVIPRMILPAASALRDGKVEIVLFLFARMIVPIEESVSLLFLLLVVSVMKDGGDLLVKKFS